MFNQFTELFQPPLKPINKLVELNISTASSLAHQQGLLIASLIDGSISFSQNMSVITDITTIIDEQSKFRSDVQSQLTAALKQTSGTLTKAQKDAEVILSDSFSVSSTKQSQTLVENQFVSPKVLIKEKSHPATKAAPKAEAKTIPKAEVKAAPKVKAKTIPKAEVKAAPKVKAKTTPKAEVKAVPKVKAVSK